MYNKTGHLGRLAQDPVIRYTQSGVKVATFDLAVPVPSKDRNTPPYYFPVVCWSKRADFAEKYLTKGRQIVVEGSLSARLYEDKEGKKRKAIEIIADRIFFADSGAGNASGGGNQASAQEAPPTAEPEGTGFTQVDDDELPF